MLDKAKLKAELLNYKGVGIYKHVNANRHVNEIEEDFDDVKAGKMLDTFIEKVKLTEGCIRVNDSLQEMVIAAKDQRRNVTKSLPQSVVDAVLVDYINYIAENQSMKYALRASDIR